MGNNKYIFWQAMGVALTVPSTTNLLLGLQHASNLMIFSLGWFCIFAGIVLTAYENSQLSRKEGSGRLPAWQILTPLYMDLGANFFVAGFFLTPSFLKVLMLIGGILLIETFLLIIFSKYFN